jgi:predicted heme/steroid binding protein
MVYLCHSYKESLEIIMRAQKRMGTQKTKSFTKKELKEFDGSEGRPAFIAFKGKVYDVSNSHLWTDGKHQGRHSAGDDLTASILNAPHNEEVFMKFYVVGELIEEKSSKQKLVQRLQGLHLHPILVHFSIAYSLLVPLLALLYLFTSEISFETASYYLLLLGFLAAPFAGVSGLFSWKVTYEGRMTTSLPEK